MSRNYRHIQEYEPEIIRLKKEEATQREIGEKLRYSFKQIHNFHYRHNSNQKKIASNIAIHRKGRPPKDHVVSEEDKFTELKYFFASKDARIKLLEKENELWRNFLSLTEKK